MKYLSVLFLSVILLTSCKSPTCSCDVEADAPLLKVSNNTCGIISSVSLVGYTFNNLAIEENDSKTFTLTDGIQAGLDDVNVNVQAYRSITGFNGDISVDFVSGQVTSISLIQGTFPNECNARYFELQLDE